MKLDELKNVWRQEIEIIRDDGDFSKAIDKVAKKTKSIDKQIRFRDIVESSVSLLLIPVWIFELIVDADNYYSYTGMVILILACSFIPFKLYKAKKIDENKLKSVKLFLELEIEKIRRQSQLLKSLFWWYLSPLFLGVFLATLGTRVDEAGNINLDNALLVYYAVCFVICVVIYFYNQWYAKKKYDPVINQLQGQLDHLQKVSV